MRSGTNSCGAQDGVLQARARPRDQAAPSVARPVSVRTSVEMASARATRAAADSLPLVGARSLPRIGACSLPLIGARSLPHIGACSLPPIGARSLPLTAG